MADEKVKRVLEELNSKMGYRRIMRQYHTVCNRWKSETINIAVSGKSGCGKSTLINTLRGLKSDDFGAAKIGPIETTREPTSYQHPNNANILLWDLPGVGTANFLKETFTEDVRFDKFDFIIFLYATRFMELDAWLPREINTRFPQATLLFVRTKVDSELADINKSRRTPLTNEEKVAILADIKNDALKQLTLAGIKNPNVFLIDSYDPTAFDFRKLVNTLIETVSEIKRELLVRSNIILTEDALQSKVDVIHKHNKIVAEVAAVAAFYSKREENEYSEIDILHKELLDNQRQLGIDKDALECIAAALKRDIGTIVAELNSESEECLKNFAQFYKIRDTVQNEIWHVLPFIGKQLKLWDYQKQCHGVLKEVTKKCINDALKLRRIIGTSKP